MRSGSSFAVGGTEWDLSPPPDSGLIRVAKDAKGIVNVEVANWERIGLI